MGEQQNPFYSNRAASSSFLSVLTLSNTGGKDRVHKSVFSSDKYLDTLFSLCLQYKALKSFKLLISLAVLL